MEVKINAESQPWLHNVGVKSHVLATSHCKPFCAEPTHWSWKKKTRRKSSCNRSHPGVCRAGTQSKIVQEPNWRMQRCTRSRLSLIDAESACRNSDYYEAEPYDYNQNRRSRHCPSPTSNQMRSFISTTAGKHTVDKAGKHHCCTKINQRHRTLGRLLLKLSDPPIIIIIK